MNVPLASRRLSFAQLREFRNQILQLCKKPKRISCSLIRNAEHRDRLAEVMQFGFPERRLFGGNTWKIRETRAVKIEHCFQYLLDFHAPCEHTSCTIRMLIQSFFSLPSEMEYTRSVSTGFLVRPNKLKPKTYPRSSTLPSSSSTSQRSSSYLVPAADQPRIVTKAQKMPGNSIKFTSQLVV